MLLLRSPSMSFHQLLLFHTQPPLACPPFNHNYFNLTRAEREIEPRDWVAFFSLTVLPHINCPGFLAVSSNLKYILAALPVSHVDTSVCEVEMRIVRWFCIIYSAWPWTAPRITRMWTKVVSHQHFAVTTCDFVDKSTCISSLPHIVIQIKRCSCKRGQSLFAFSFCLFFPSLVLLMHTPTQ